MEFVVVETFANESNTALQDALLLAEEAEAGEKDDNEHPLKQRRVQYSPHVMPPVSDKNAAFESFLIVPERGIFGGRHDGRILHWRLQTTPYGPPPATRLNGHIGTVVCMAFSSAYGKEGLLFSGSADRSIKIWDVSGGADGIHMPLLQRNRELACFQSIPAHEASVTSLELMTQHNHGLVSCSLDHSVKIWYPESSSALYPKFVLAQTITMSSGHWPTSLCIRDGASCSLFVGDSTGCLSLYTSGRTLSDDLDSNQSAGLLAHEASVDKRHGVGSIHFRLKRKHAHFHTLRIVTLQLIADNAFVVSLGFDQKAQVIDAISGVLSTTITNSNPTRFTSCAWDQRDQLLFLSDAMGFVHIWNIFQDKRVKKERLFDSDQSIVTIAIASGLTDCLFAGIANGMRQWRINRDVGYRECPGHSEPVVCFAIVPDDPLVTDSKEDQAQIVTSRFFSASLDNTLRCWDSYDMKVAYGFEEKDSEITCMIMSKKFQKIVTGHDAGLIKAWGVYTGQFQRARLPKPSAVTCLASGIIRDQEFVVAGDVDGWLSVYELQPESLTLSATINTHEDSDKHDDIVSLWFDRGEYLEDELKTPLSALGKEFVVVGYNSGTIAIWNLSKKLRLHRWKAHDDVVTSLVMHGCFLFSASEDTTIRIWNLFDLEHAYQLQRLQLPGSMTPVPSAIACLDVMEEEGLVFSAAVDGTILLWDYTTCEDEHDFATFGKVVYHTRHDSHIRCLKYWPAQHAVIAGTNEGKILVFELPDQLIHR